MALEIKPPMPQAPTVVPEDQMEITAAPDKKGGEQETTEVTKPAADPLVQARKKPRRT